MVDETPEAIIYTDPAVGAGAPQSAPEPVGVGGDPSVPRVIERGQIETRLEASLKAAKEARDEHFDKWCNHWRLIGNQYDYSAKAKWQSKGYVAKLSRQVGYVVGISREAVVKDPSWAAVDGDTELARLTAPILQRIGYDCLDRHGFRKAIKSNVKAGLLTPAMLWAVKPAPSPSYPGDTLVEPVDMRCIVRDPTGRDKYVFYLTAMDYADVARNAGPMGWDPAVVRALADENGEDEDAVWKKRLMEMLSLKDGEKDRRTVYLAEYYGPIYDDAGEVYQYAHAVLANGRHLLADPNPDPYGDGKGCIVGEDMDAQLGAPYGKSYVEDAAGPAEYATKLYNIMMDAAPYAVKAFQANSANLVNRNQLKGGLKAGTIYETRSNEAAILPIDTGGFDQSLLALYTLNDQEIQAATSATNDARGLDNETRNDMTLGEVQLKQQANDRNLSSVAMDIEDLSLVPMWERLLYMIGRYIDLNDPTVQKVAEHEIRAALNKLRQTPDLIPVEARQALQMGMDPDTVLLSVLQAAMGERHTVRVRGLSSRLEKRERASSALRALTAMGEFGLGARVDPDKAFELVCVVNDIQPDDIGYSEEEWKQREQDGPPPPPDPVRVAFTDLPPAARAAWLEKNGYPSEGVEDTPDNAKVQIDAAKAQNEAERHAAELRQRQAEHEDSMELEAVKLLHAGNGNPGGSY
jgi:hypothetical protein